MGNKTTDDDSRTILAEIEEKNKTTAKRNRKTKRSRKEKTKEKPMTPKITQFIQDTPFILADGATGTNLFNAGLQAGDPPEFWNEDAPDKIIALYQGFVDAGSDLFLTNSFGANASRLALHKAENRVHALAKKISRTRPHGRR